MAAAMGEARGRDDADVPCTAADDANAVEAVGRREGRIQVKPFPKPPTSTKTPQPKVRGPAAPPAKSDTAEPSPLSFDDVPDHVIQQLIVGEAVTGGDARALERLVDGRDEEELLAD